MEHIPWNAGRIIKIKKSLKVRVSRIRFPHVSTKHVLNLTVPLSMANYRILSQSRIDIEQGPHSLQSCLQVFASFFNSIPISLSLFILIQEHVCLKSTFHLVATTYLQQLVTLFGKPCYLFGATLVFLWPACPVPFCLEKRLPWPKDQCRRQLATLLLPVVAGPG